MLHSFCAVVMIIVAIRDRLGFLWWLFWGAVGFLTGLLGLVSRWRFGQQLSYMQIFQDAFLNAMLEVAAFLLVPHLLR
jgi:hypothetical protein